MFSCHKSWQKSKYLETPASPSLSVKTHLKSWLELLLLLLLPLLFLLLLLLPLLLLGLLLLFLSVHNALCLTKIHPTSRPPFRSVNFGTYPKRPAMCARLDRLLCTIALMQ